MESRGSPSPGCASPARTRGRCFTPRTAGSVCSTDGPAAALAIKATPMRMLCPALHTLPSGPGDQRSGVDVLVPPPLTPLHPPSMHSVWSQIIKIIPQTNKSLCLLPDFRSIDTLGGRQEAEVRVVGALWVVRDEGAMTYQHRWHSPGSWQVPRGHRRNTPRLSHCQVRRQVQVLRGHTGELVYPRIPEAVGAQCSSETVHWLGSSPAPRPEALAHASCLERASK